MQSANVRATGTGTSSAFVKIGNATAPPPAGVAPARNDPAVIVSADSQCVATRLNSPDAST